MDIPAKKDAALTRRAAKADEKGAVMMTSMPMGRATMPIRGTTTPLAGREKVEKPLK